MFPAELQTQVQQILLQCRMQQMTLTTAESCTGGLLSALITEIPGSSDVFTFGFITYANEAKMRLLGVREKTLQHYGAVSEETAIAMAEGAIACSGATLSIAITGIAGPGGGSAEKPVGLVHLASRHAQKSTRTVQHIFTGNRSEIRLQAVKTALDLLQQQLAT